MFPAAVLAALTLASAPPAQAEASDIDRATDMAFKYFCVPLFDGRPVDQSRLSDQGTRARMTAVPGRGWSNYSQGSDFILANWEAETDSCLILVFGPAGSGDSIVDGFGDKGWREHERSTPASEGWVVDLWSGQPTIADGVLLVVVERRKVEVAAEPGRAAPRIAIRVLRAP